MSYLYETHLHTAPSSICAVSSGADYIRAYKDLGYTGIIVTDHFYNGNTAIPRNLPWQEWVKRFYRSYEKTKEEGDRRGLDVFFGWEETFDGCDDYLIYGLDREWLFEHPEARYWTRGEQYRIVTAAGGCVVQAHPFRQHHYITRIVLSTGCVDAVEARNACNREQSYDALAIRYAKKLGLPVTAGSDAHEALQICKGNAFGVYLEKKLDGIDGYVDAIHNHKISGLMTGQGRFDEWVGDSVALPVEIRDANDMITQKNLRDVL